MAWDRLSLLYAPLVFHWCRRRGLREADAADIVQDVFQAVATHLQPFRKQEPADTFRGWLRTITENKIHDHFRRTAHETDAVGGTERNTASPSFRRRRTRGASRPPRTGTGDSSAASSMRSTRSSRNGPGRRSGAPPSRAAPPGKSAPSCR